MTIIVQLSSLIILKSSLIHFLQICVCFLQKGCNFPVDIIILRLFCTRMTQSLIGYLVHGQKLPCILCTVLQDVDNTYTLNTHWSSWISVSYPNLSSQAHDPRPFQSDPFGWQCLAFFRCLLPQYSTRRCQGVGVVGSKVACSPRGR